MLSHPCTTSGPLERCGPISAGIASIHHPVDNVLKALSGHFEYPVKLHGITIHTKFATHVRWSVLPSPGFSPAIVLVDEHGEKGNDVLSLIVRNLSIDECLFNKGTIVQRMDNQMSSFSAKPSLDQKQIGQMGLLKTLIRVE